MISGYTRRAVSVPAHRAPIALAAGGRSALLSTRPGVFLGGLGGRDPARFRTAVRGVGEGRRRRALDRAQGAQSGAGGAGRHRSGLRMHEVGVGMAGARRSASTSRSPTHAASAGSLADRRGLPMQGARMADVRHLRRLPLRRDPRDAAGVQAGGRAAGARLPVRVLHAARRDDGVRSGGQRHLRDRARGADAPTSSARARAPA